MTVIDLKRHVEQALATEWTRFAAEHPALAAQLDRDVVIERATASLRDDPEFIAAMRNAAAASVAADALAQIVAGFVTRWLRRLAG